MIRINRTTVLPIAFLCLAMMAGSKADPYAFETMKAKGVIQEVIDPWDDTDQRVIGYRYNIQEMDLIARPYPTYETAAKHVGPGLFGSDKPNRNIGLFSFSSNEGLYQAFLEVRHEQIRGILSILFDETLHYPHFNDEYIASVVPANSGAMAASKKPEVWYGEWSSLSLINLTDEEYERVHVLLVKLMTEDYYKPR